MSIFDGLGKAETFEKGSYLNPGFYVVKIERCLAKKSRESGVGLIVELEILQSTFRPQVDPKNQNRTWQNTPAGVKGTWWQGMEVDGAMGSIKVFVRAALGLRTSADTAMIAELDGYPPGLVDGYGKPVAVIENMMNLAIGSENVFAGFLVNLECFVIETEKRKNDFTIHNWSALDFSSLGFSGPPVRALIDRCRSQHIPPPNPNAPPGISGSGWGQTPAPLQGPVPGYGPAFGPPQAPSWGQPPAPPAWRSGPPAALPLVPPPWTPPPGSSLSQDGCWFSYPGGQWQRVPGR